MPNYNIDRDNFLKLLDQFRGDLPYIQRLFNKVASLMPEEYRKQLYNDLYHQFVYEKEYYVAEHYIYSDQKYYFKTFEDLYEFLKDKNLEKEFPVMKNKVMLALNTPFPISGYKIAHVTKE